MNKQLTISLGQINPTIGDFKGNITLMRNAAFEAQAAEADMVVFPELSLTGYSPSDLLDDNMFQQRLEQAQSALYEASKATPDVYWVVGLPIRRSGRGGRPYYNALQVLLNGEVVHTQYKQLLPTYGVFDERRHFEPGPDVGKVLRIRGVTIGWLVCEDAWNDTGLDYPVNPFQRLADASPDLVISINASPSHKGKRQVRHSVISKACARHKLPLVYVAQVGGHDQLVFDGASFAVNATGEVVFEAKRFDSDVPTIRLDVESQAFMSETGEKLPPVAAEGLPVMEFYRQQLVLGIRDYARRCGFTKALLGMSGGIDSALTLMLAVEALGAPNVVAVTMPSTYSSEGSVLDSELMCQNLGVQLIELPIQEMVDQSCKSFEANVGEAPRGLALENLQARIRGMMLMTYSNQYGQLLLTTGNKSELSVGFCTLGGDVLGGLCVPGDLYKTEVVALCEHINASYGREVIPVAIITKPPSAELSPGQMDTDSLPPYPVLDEILKVHIEGDLLDVEERRHANAVVRGLMAGHKGLDTVVKVRQLIARSEYKRRQAPPVIRVRARAFGVGRQVPITAKQY